MDKSAPLSYKLTLWRKSQQISFFKVFGLNTHFVKCQILYLNFSDLKLMMQILSSDGTPKVFVEGHGLFIEFYHPVTYMQSFPTILNSYGKQKIV